MKIKADIVNNRFKLRKLGTTSDVERNYPNMDASTKTRQNTNENGVLP
jgi:hypothetical protein